MKKLLRPRLFVLLLGICLLAFLLTWGLYPLSNQHYHITFAPDKVTYRQSFLDQPIKKDTHNLPNIILILADDLSIQDVSSYGGKNVPTPNIDAIGANGVQFTDAYVASPVCAPSRAALMTGRYPQRFGFEINIHERYPQNRLEYFVYSNFIATGNWKVADHKDWAIPTKADIQKQGLPPTEFTLAELLKKHGYQTAAFGKWHMGYNDTAIPINRGFDYHYGFYEAFSLYAPEDKTDIVNQHLSDFSDPFIWQKGRTGTCAIRRNHQVIEDTSYITFQIAQETNQWITAHQEAPFFAFVPFSAPHTPFQAPQAYYDLYEQVESPEKRIYYAMIHALDDAVGEIMNHLRKLNLEENTLVFFLSDNGGAEYTLAADNSPLKGGKFTNFEGGIQVPFMMQWKGTIPSGMVYEQPVSALDIFATCADVTHLELPEDRAFDGVNLMSYLLDTAYQDQFPHETLYWRSENHKAIRDGNWKLIQDDLANQTILYNLKEDKAELQDLSGTYPYIRGQLLEKLKQWETRLINPSWPRVMDYEIHEGGSVFYFPL